jgi:hypothetical protein
MSASVTVTMDMPFDLAGILTISELEVLETFGEDSVMLAASQWVGWKYGPNYPDAQKGTSREAWKWSALQPGEEGFSRGVAVFNDAEVKTGTQRGRNYAGFVHRSGDTTKEWTVVFDRMVNDLLPAATEELKDTMLRNLSGSRQAVTLEADDPSVLTHQFNLITGITS